MVNKQVMSGKRKCTQQHHTLRTQHILLSIIIPSSYLNCKSTSTSTVTVNTLKVKVQSLRKMTLSDPSKSQIFPPTHPLPNLSGASPRTPDLGGIYRGQAPEPPTWGAQKNTTRNKFTYTSPLLTSTSFNALP